MALSWNQGVKGTGESVLRYTFYELKKDEIKHDELSLGCKKFKTTKNRFLLTVSSQCLASIILFNFSLAC